MRRAFSLLLLFGGASFLAADQTVTVGPGISFTPSTVTVAPGEKVTWAWAAGGHSSTSDATTGPEVWDSGILAISSTFSHTFTTPGTYPYYCKVHGAPGGVGMSGVVQVVAPVATPTPTPAPAGPPGPIPALGLAGRLALIVGLAAVGILSLSFALKR